MCVWACLPAAGLYVSARLPDGTSPLISRVHCYSPSDWVLGDWLQPKSWTIDQGHHFLQGPAILAKYVGLLDELFPTVTVPHASGDRVVGMTLILCVYVFGLSL